MGPGFLLLSVLHLQLGSNQQAVTDWRKRSHIVLLLLEEAQHVTEDRGSLVAHCWVWHAVAPKGVSNGNHSTRTQQANRFTQLLL